MIEVIFLAVLALIWIVFAVIQDLRSREIADWLNFSLVIFALGFRFFYSLFSQSYIGFSFFYQGLIGFVIFFALGNLFYYGRMFAGGDAKLMMALGAVLPFSSNLLFNFRILLTFLFSFLLVGAVYGLISSLIVGAKNFKELNSEMRRQFKKSKKFYFLFVLLALVTLVGSFFLDYLLVYLAILIFLFPFLHLYARSVDKACMVKEISTRKLSEGDWLYKDVKVGKKLIKASWDGISKDDIKLLKRKDKVKVREGIAFSPVFLISFVVLIIVYFFKPELISSLWNSLW